MKFIVDAQLPKSLSDFLISKGQDSIHTIDLPAKNKTKDSQIEKIAITENRIVITKDSDFLQSYLIRHQPEKLILIKTGNIPNNQLLKIFEQNIEYILNLLGTNSLIEIDRNEIIVHLDKM